MRSFFVVYVSRSSRANNKSCGEDENLNSRINTQSKVIPDHKIIIDSIVCIRYQSK